MTAVLTCCVACPDAAGAAMLLLAVGGTAGDGHDADGLGLLDAATSLPSHALHTLPETAQRTLQS